MGTGQLPFRGETSAVIFEAIMNRAPTSPLRLNPELPEKFEAILQKALDKDRNLRYQSAAEMRTDLLRLKREVESGSNPSAFTGLTEEDARRTGTMAALTPSGSAPSVPATAASGSAISSGASASCSAASAPSAAAASSASASAVAVRTHAAATRRWLPVLGGMLAIAVIAIAVFFFSGQSCASAYR